ncbi:hypothetical protein C0J52_08133 [Blattella germanica]|nr:hypothetical protein C0J52_08133 [Blattella germanica]
MYALKSLTTDEIIAIFEDDDCVIDADIYIPSPENHEMSDGHSGNEDCEVATIHDLSGNLEYNTYMGLNMDRSGWLRRDGSDQKKRSLGSYTRVHK